MPNSPRSSVDEWSQGTSSAYSDERILSPQPSEEEPQDFNLYDNFEYPKDAADAGIQLNPIEPASNHVSLADDPVAVALGGIAH